MNRTTERNVWGITTIGNSIYFTTGNDNFWKLSDNFFSVVLSDNTKWMTGVVWNQKDKLFICDHLSHRILQYDMETENVSVLAGTGKEGHTDGILEQAMFSYPEYITMDNNGDLYVTDWNHVKKIDLRKGTVETIAGSTVIHGGYQDGESLQANFDHPSGIAVSRDGTIYVCDYANHCIRKIKDGIVSTIAGTPGKRGFEHGKYSMFTFPRGLALDGDTNLLVTDFYAVRRIDVLNNIVSWPKQLYGIRDPRSVACNSQNGIIVVGTSDSIVQIDNTWKWKRFLWIGFMKEHSSYCWLARLPKDIVKEVASHMMTNLIKGRKRMTMDFKQAVTLKKLRI